MAARTTVLRLIVATTMATSLADVRSFAQDVDAPVASQSPEFPRAVAGRVTIGKDHPLPGVLVEWGYYSEPPENRETVETDADGRYRLETSRAGRDFRLGFSMRGFAPLWQDRLIPGPASKPSKVDVTLERAAEITVQFVADGGEPVADIEITPQTPSNGFISSFSSPTPPTPLPGRDRAVVTDDDGRATLRDLPPLPVAGKTDAERSTRCAPATTGWCCTSTPAT